MDAQRFDTLAKRLAGRLSRRHALRGAGAAASATMLAAVGVRPPEALARAQNGDGSPVFTMIRRYTLSVPVTQVRAALDNGYVADACKAPGFVAYFAVEGDNNELATIAVFSTQQDLDNFTDAEADWIQQNLANLLPSPDEAISGLSYIHAADTEAFPNTCDAPPPSVPTPTPAPAPPTAVPPTAAPPTATSGPGPSPTPVPATATPTPAPCTSQGCACNGGVQGNCDQGLVCCQGGQPIPGGAGTCEPEAQCAPPPCTGQGCTCNGGVQGNCDQGLVCCQNGQPIPGGAGTCQPEAQCAPPPCTGEGCACNGGVQGNCDQGLVCCQGGQPIPGGQGTCTAEANCAPPPCTGQGCDCNGGVQGNCDQGLVCCQGGQPIPGGAGTCEPEAQCGPTCTGNGDGCDASCNWGDDCAACCSGFCNSTGQCDNAPPPPCTGQGCACTTGTLGACDDGLSCCATGGDPGAPGVCQASC